MKTLIKNIGCIATVRGNAAKSGKAQGDVTFTENAWILCEDGKITDIGTGDAPCGAVNTVDAEGNLLTAGLVDSHTHLVFGGWRENELAMKLHGVEYLDILRQGGGILSTVKFTRAASEDELTEKTRDILSEMLALGTTTCEAKSGYGLSVEAELKQLRVVKKLNETQSVELVSTFMAAHAVPPEYKGNKSGYVDEIVNNMLPEIKDLAEFCDVFCETAVFDAQDSKRILEAAQRMGLGAKIHADEIDPIGGSELAGEIGAISAEHLIACRESGIRSMAKGGTVAVCLPCTSFYLGKGFAPARDMIEAGVPVAIASDFNPGSTPNLSLQLAMNMGCYKYRMTPEEVLTAVTLNAAAAIGRADKIGTVEVGKQADFVIWDAPNLNRVFYRYGHNQVKTVIKHGEVIKK
ncbi:MAG: imidazolonepropionase [Clostridia bacterium]|nr:imidazolonepropionase [Clostridia bacterium]